MDTHQRHRTSQCGTMGLDDDDDDESSFVETTEAMAKDTTSSHSSNNSSKNNSKNESEASGAKALPQDNGESHASDALWTLHIRTVDAGVSDFCLSLHPNDSVERLYDSVEAHTSWAPSEQRLIYRGRLLPPPPSPSSSSSLLPELSGNDTNDQDPSHSPERNPLDGSVGAPQRWNDDDNDNHADNDGPPGEPDTTDKEHKDDTVSHPPRMHEIAGLADGHTIHLMRKQPQHPPSQDRTDTTTSDTASATAEAATRHLDNNDDDDDGGFPTSSLLAALLDSTSGGGGGSSPTTPSGRPRRPPYRLRAADLVRAPVAGMEPVRQGLLTLHSALSTIPSSCSSSGQSRPEEFTAEQEPSHSECVSAATTTNTAPRRQWYRGQWIDCLDTVNHWLEATIMEIAEPQDVLPLSDDESNTTTTHASASTPPLHLRRRMTRDPAVSVTNLESRLLLLLEPYSPNTDTSPSTLVHTVDDQCYRRRPHDTDVQLLHVHYNGWPERWDEWIRSDSERIRPFCVRTRHASHDTTALPTVQTELRAAPPTGFFTGGDRDDDDSRERSALVPELARVMAQVQDLLQSAADSVNSDRTAQGVVSDAQLPWQQPAGPTTTTTLSPTTRQSRRRRRVQQSLQLETLAPLLDRLGRTLTDAAPHVHSLAASLYPPNDDDDSSVHSGDDSSVDQPAATSGNTLGGLLSLLSRERSGRRRNHNSHTQEQSVGSNVAVPSLNGDVSASVASSTTGGGNEHATVTEDDGNETDDDEEDREEDDEPAPMDPDHADFLNGFVNTTRGDLPRGPRGIAGGSRNGLGSDEVASFLGAYLAAASMGGGMTSTGGGGGLDLGGMLGNNNRNANGGGGIDIHIHAVLSSPGESGMDGLAAAVATDDAGGSGTLTRLPVFGAMPGMRGADGTGAAPARRRIVRVLPPRPGNPTSSAATASAIPASVVSSSPESSAEEDMGIFAELYSENPDPVNPNGSTPGSATAATTGHTPQAASVESSDRETYFDATTSSNNSSGATPVSPRRSGSRNSSHPAGPASSSARSPAAHPRRGVFGRLFRRPPDHNE